MVHFPGIKQWELALGFMQRKKKKLATELSQKGTKRVLDLEALTANGPIGKCCC